MGFTFDYVLAVMFPVYHVCPPSSSRTMTARRFYLDIDGSLWHHSGTGKGKDRERKDKFLDLSPCYCVSG